MQWDSAGATNANIAMMRTLYTSMRCFGWMLCELLRSRSRRRLCKSLLGRQPRPTHEDQGRGRSEKHIQTCPERAIELKRFRGKVQNQRSGQRSGRHFIRWTRQRVSLKSNALPPRLLGRSPPAYPGTIVWRVITAALGMSRSPTTFENLRSARR